MTRKGSFLVPDDKGLFGLSLLLSHGLPQTRTYTPQSGQFSFSCSCSVLLAAINGKAGAELRRSHTLVTRRTTQSDQGHSTVTVTVTDQRVRSDSKDTTDRLNTETPSHFSASVILCLCPRQRSERTKCPLEPRCDRRRRTQTVRVGRSKVTNERTNERTSSAASPNNAASLAPPMI